MEQSPEKETSGLTDLVKIINNPRHAADPELPGADAEADGPDGPDRSSDEVADAPSKSHDKDSPGADVLLF